MIDLKRTYKICTNTFAIGDIIELGSGITATCQKITNGGEYALFILDQYLDEAKTHEDAQPYMNQLFAESEIFDRVKDLIVPFKSGNALRLPYTEEFFGPLDCVIPSGKEQWPLMKDRRNRIASRKAKEYEWGWLMNQHKEFASYFAIVDAYGYSYCFSASYTSGVRPVFRLRNADV